MLEHLDQQLFLFINSHNSPFWDTVMYTLSGRVIWAPLYLAILIYLGVRYKRKFLVILIFIILAVAMADQFSVQLFKNIFHRLRPCHEPSLQGLIHLVNGECGGLYGFVGIRLREYASHARPISPAWDTVAMPTERFRDLAEPVESFF